MQSQRVSQGCAVGERSATLGGGGDAARAEHRKVAIDTCASRSGGAHRMLRATGFHPLCVCGAEDIVAWGVDGDRDRGSEGRRRDADCSDGKKASLAFRGECGSDWLAAASSSFDVQCARIATARREPPFGGGEVQHRCWSQIERRRGASADNRYGNGADELAAQYLIYRS